MRKNSKRIIAVLLSLTVLTSTATLLNSVAEEGTDTATVNAEPIDFACAQNDNGYAILLANKGASNYKIVIPENASKTEKYAAEELQYFMQQSTDCFLPIITDEGLAHDNSQKYLSIGKTSLLSAQTDITFATNTPRNAPVIQTRDNTVYMTGAYDEGTLYSVYKFLHYQVGFEAYAVDCVDYEKHSVLKLLDFDYTYVPAMSYSAGMYEDTELANLAALGRMCMRSSSYTYDSKIWAAWCHSTEGLAGEVSTMEALHPEWYWTDSETGDRQMCQTNDELMQHLATESVKRLDSTGAPYTMLGGADNGVVCGCDTCTAAYETYGVGGVHIRYLNQIATYMEAIYAERGEDREFVLYGLAYLGYLESPTTPDVNGDPVALDESVYCNENVGICYTPLGACWTHALDDEECTTNSYENYYYHLKGYDLLTDNLAVYGYTTNFNGYFTPFNDWNSYKENAELYQKHGVKYVFHQGNTHNETSPFQSLRIYLQGKLAWDPTVDVEETISDFMAHYYGAAAKDVRRFYDDQAEHFEWIRSKKLSEGVVNAYGNAHAEVTDKAYWSYDTLQRFQTTLNAALNAIAVSDATEEEKAQQSKNVYKEYVMVKMYEYLQFSEYYTVEQKAAVKAEMQTAMKELGITRSAEHVMLELQ